MHRREPPRYPQSIKPSVYLETTIPSYLTARPSRDIVQAANQQITREWRSRRERYDLYISQLVIDECQDGDPEASADRLAVLADINVVEESVEATAFASLLSQAVGLPRRAATEALHVAIATIQGLEYFLTRNCRQIANLSFLPRIDAFCRKSGCLPPAIGTPQQFFGSGTSR